MTPFASRHPVGISALRFSIAVWGLRVAIAILALLGWQILGHSSKVWLSDISSPGRSASVLYHWVISGSWWRQLGTTLEEAFFGYLLGVVSALLLVSVVAPIKALSKFLAPFVAAFNALPKIVLIPLFILWFGTSTRSKVYFVATSIFFILFYGMYTGLQSIDPLYIDNARALGATRLQQVREVYIPAVLTWLITGLRLSFAFALLAAVIAEYLGAASGIGYLIQAAQTNYDSGTVLAGVFVIAVVGLIGDRALVRVERRFSPWRVF